MLVPKTGVFLSSDRSSKTTPHMHRPGFNVDCLEKWFSHIFCFIFTFHLNGGKCSFEYFWSDANRDFSRHGLLFFGRFFLILRSYHCLLGVISVGILETWKKKKKRKRRRLFTSHIFTGEFTFGLPVLLPVRKNGKSTSTPSSAVVAFVDFITHRTSKMRDRTHTHANARRATAMVQQWRKFPFAFGRMLPRARFTIILCPLFCWTYRCFCMAVCVYMYQYFDDNLQKSVNKQFCFFILSLECAEHENA